MRRAIKLKNLPVENPEYSPAMARAAWIMALSAFALLKLGII